MRVLMTRDEALTMPLWYRELLLRERGLFRAAPDPAYNIVWENPDDLDEPIHIVTPSAEWLAMAMHGNVLPPVQAYHLLRTDGNGVVLNGYLQHIAVIPALSEQQAMEYLLMKDVPRQVWSKQGGNRRHFSFVPRASISDNRIHRMAWTMDSITAPPPALPQPGLLPEQRSIHHAAI